METIFKNLAQKIDIELSDEQINKFFVYKDLLKEWNQKINLTAIDDDMGIILKHFIDSLTIEKYVDDGTTLVDVGTGAGFPGIPIKIVNQSISVTLVDSLNKRINFLNEVIDKIDLKKIKCTHGRAEDVSRETLMRENFDYATARAVANLSTLAELCLPFVKIGGEFICMKGNNIKDELNEAQKSINVLGGEIISTEKIILPETDIERNIVIIKKVKSTPPKYPRKAGTPAKEPIK